MSRLRSPTVKYVALVVIGIVFVYGFFSYHDVSTKLRTVEEKLSHVSQQHDSVSAQLQGNLTVQLYNRHVARVIPTVG